MSKNPDLLIKQAVLLIRMIRETSYFNYYEVYLTTLKLKKSEGKK